MTLRYSFWGIDVENMGKKEINALFRSHDESHLFPINGRFNATDRAIRKLQKLKREGNFVADKGFEYATQLDHMISEIVNSNCN